MRPVKTGALDVETPGCARKSQENEGVTEQGYKWSQSLVSDLNGRNDSGILTIITGARVSSDLAEGKRRAGLRRV